MQYLYAIHHSDREHWENALSLAGLTLTALLPDFLLLPTEILPKVVANNGEVTPQSAIYYQDTATQLLALPQTNSQSIGLAVSHLPMLLAKMPQLENLWLMNDNGLNPQQFASFPQLAIHTMEALPRPAIEPTRAFYNFAVKRTESNVSAYVKIIGLVMITAMICGLIVEGLRWYYYQKALEQTKSALAIQYNQWFPNEKFNPQLSMQRQLQGKLINNQNKDSKVLATLASIQPVFQQNQITAINLNFQGQNLQLNVTANNSDTLNKTVNQLVAHGMNAKLGSISGNTSGITNPTVSTGIGATSSPAGINNSLAITPRASTGTSIATIQIIL